MNPKPGPPPGTDGFHSEQDIASRMSQKYQNLYNGVPSSFDNFMKIKDAIDAKMQTCSRADCFFSLSDVEKWIEDPKPMKNDGNVFIQSTFVQQHPILH